MKNGKLFLLALIVAAGMMFSAGEAQARRFTLQNATSMKISVALVVPWGSGWMVKGWYNVAPYSYKRINLDGAHGSTFGYYAQANGGKIKWCGKSSDPAIMINNNKMQHHVRQNPGGSGLKKVNVRMRKGNSIKLTYTPPAGSAITPKTNAYW